MKTVTVNIKLVFEAEEVDEETLKEAVYGLLEEKMDEDELMESAKVKIVDDEDEDEMGYEEDEED